MRLNKRDLASKLGCSERALTTWQQQGLPVLEHGRRGQSNTYDVAAVLAWIKQTGAGLVHNARQGRTPINLEALERELTPSLRSAAEDVFNYLTEQGIVTLAARFHAQGRNIEQSLELVGDCFDVFWNVLVDRFGTTDFAYKSEHLLNPVYDERDPDRRGLVERIYKATASERRKLAPELELTPRPVQMSALAPGAELQDQKGDANGPAGD